jgi:threonine dehydratase/serine racemase
MTSTALDELVGCRVHLKCEHLQRTGSFKIRGATNAVFSLDEERARRGVAAHSSGNHAAALAFAARARGISCRVVMPSNAPLPKRQATAAYGAEVVLCDPTLEAREATLAEIVERTGATEIHPYDDPRVIAGQGTAALELLTQVPDIGAVVAPVSGGGLLSGTAIATHGIDGGIVVVGAEPATVDDARRSLATGERTSDGNGTSIADGLLAVLSDRTFGILRDHAVAVEAVTEDEILDATWFVMERTKQVVEPSAATAVAALVAMARRGAVPADDVGVILSGGNVDLGRLPSRSDRSARW